MLYQGLGAITESASRFTSAATESADLPMLTTDSATLGAASRTASDAWAAEVIATVADSVDALMSGYRSSRESYVSFVSGAAFARTG